MSQSCQRLLQGHDLAHLRDTLLGIGTLLSTTVVEEGVIRPDVEADTLVISSWLVVLRIVVSNKVVVVDDVDRRTLTFADISDEIGRDSTGSPVSEFVGLVADRYSPWKLFWHPGRWHFHSHSSERSAVVFSIGSSNSAVVCILFSALVDLFRDHLISRLRSRHQDISGGIAYRNRIALSLPAAQES